jgi:hypothetical protein
MAAKAELVVKPDGVLVTHHVWIDWTRISTEGPSSRP